MARLILSSTGIAALNMLSSPAIAQRLGGGSAPDISIGRVVAALVLCLFAICLVVLTLKRGGGLNLSQLRPLAGVPIGRRISIIETRRISQHADLCLVRCDGRDFLILTSQQQQTVLRESDSSCA